MKMTLIRIVLILWEIYDYFQWFYC